MLAGQGLAFNFSLSVGSTFSFSLEARGKGQALVTQGKTKKKKTPSTLRRNARRRTEFLKKKLEDSPGNEDVSAKEAVKKVVECGSFKCEQCENVFKSENGLKIHAGAKLTNSEFNHINAPEVEAAAGGLGEPPPSGTPAGRSLACLNHLLRLPRLLHLLHLTSVLCSHKNPVEGKSAG